MRQSSVTRPTDRQATVNPKEALKPGTSKPVTAGPANKIAATEQTPHESAATGPREERNLSHGGGGGTRPKNGEQERKKRGGAKKGDGKKGEGKKGEENRGQRENRGSEIVRPSDRGGYLTTPTDKRGRAETIDVAKFTLNVDGNPRDGANSVNQSVAKPILKRDVGERIDEEDEVQGSLVSLSMNSDAILNWNVTGAREDEEDDPDWDPDNVIFAVHETEHNTAGHNHHDSSHGHHHHHHHRKKNVEKVSREDAESQLMSAVALVELEHKINEDPINWAPLSEQVGFRKTSPDNIFARTSLGPAPDTLRRTSSAGAIGQPDNEENYMRFDIMEASEEELTWSAPSNVGDPNQLDKSPSIETAFENARKKRGEKSVIPPKSEDVASIISTVVEPTNDAMEPRRKNHNIRRRIGLAFIGVAMVCGLAGVSFSTSGRFDELTDADQEGRERERGGRVGMGRSLPSGRSRTGSRVRSGHCEDPTKLIAPPLSSTSSAPRLECSPETNGRKEYPFGTVCTLSCGRQEYLEGPEKIRCRKFDGGQWCHILSFKICRELDFKQNRPLCLAQWKAYHRQK